MATTSTTQAPPKKTMFKTLFKGGGGGGASGKSKSPTPYPHPTTSSQSTTQGPNEIHNAGCTCCKKKFSLRQSFRKSTCHGCHKKVCKKCYLVNKLCHKCVVKQRPEVNSTAELLKIDSDRLIAILNQVHCDSTLIEASKNDQNAMVRTLLNICELKSTLIEYEKSISEKNVTLRHDQTAPKKPRVSAKQPDNLPPNSTFIDMHRISMPPQNEGDAEFTVITKHLEVSTSQEQSTDVVQLTITNGYQHHQTVEQSPEEESLIVQSPNMKNSPHFVAFLPDHVIEEEDENEKEEVELVGTFEYPGDPVFITPPLTPTSNRKSQIEIFHSTTEIPQMEEKNEKSLDDQTKESLGFAKLTTGEENFLIENHEEQVEVDSKNEVANEILRLSVQVKEEHNEIGENNFELKLNSLNQAYRSQYKVKLGDLATIPSEGDVGQLSLFELKTILQKRGRPITGLISYEDFVQKVTSVLEEEKNAKEVERKAREEEEEKSRQELERRLEEEMRKMEDERQCLEEAERFKKLYEEEHGLREDDAEEEESDGEEQQLSEDEVEMEFERAEVIQAEVKTAKMMKTEVDDMDQIEFEMIENRLQIEEIEEEWKTSAITYIEIAPPGQPEMVELDDEDSLTSLPPAPSPPPIT